MNVRGQAVLGVEDGVGADEMAALRALAEHSRARVITRLAHGEHCVCDLGDALGLSPALISHHLKVLREAGLIRERHGGRWVYYSLEIEALARLRRAVDGLLDPPDATQASRLCTDCRRPSAPELAPRRGERAEAGPADLNRAGPERAALGGHRRRTL